MDDDHFPVDSDAGGYIDAATLALLFSSVDLGPVPDVLPGEAVPDVDPVTPRQLRDVMGCLVTGVCIVTTTWDGEDVAMTANSVTSLSLDPPLILVCVARSARLHHALVGAEAWGVSILEADAVEVSRRLSRPGRDRSTEFEGITLFRGEATGVALIGASCATIECIRHAVHPGGDHSIVVGRVRTASQRADAQHPLVYHRGDYSWLGT